MMKKDDSLYLLSPQFQTGEIPFTCGIFFAQRKILLDI